MRWSIKAIGALAVSSGDTALEPPLSLKITLHPSRWSAARILSEATVG